MLNYANTPYVRMHDIAPILKATKINNYFHAYKLCNYISNCIKVLKTLKARTIIAGFKSPGSVFSYKLRYIVGFWLAEMAISTNQKPTIYRNLYENKDPDLLLT